MMAQYGLLLTNIGTPRSTSPSDVGVYLDEFLMDPNVIRAPWLVRAALVKGIIVPFRSAKSAKNYEKIWTPEGSPLMVHSKKFAEKLQQALGPEWAVRVGMRYGQPSFKEALKSMQVQNLKKLIVFPLFPQYALSSTQTSIDWARQSLQELGAANVPVKNINSFYDHPGFIGAWKNLFQESAPKEFDHVIMSFHGLPKGHLTTLNSACNSCPRTTACTPHADPKVESSCLSVCYRKQSYKTAALIAEALNLSADQYTVSFQSRLGPKEWILPNTVEVIDDLRKKKIDRVVVLCPSFVADCLETLEEVQISLKEKFLSQGGKEFTAISCLNAHPMWIQAAQEIACTNLR